MNVSPIDPIGCRIASPPLRDEDGTIIDTTDDAELFRRIREAERAKRDAAEAEMRARSLAAADRKAALLAAQPTHQTRNGYRIVKDTEFAGVYHLLDADGTSITHGKLTRMRQVADELD